MSVDLQYDSVGFPENVLDYSCDVPVDCDMNLPDSCPEIFRLLFCRISPMTVSSKKSGDTVYADGNVFVKAVYASEDGDIYSYDSVIPFSKQAPVSADVSAAFRTEAFCEHSSYRVVSPRRLQIRGTVKLIFSAVSVSSLRTVKCINEKNVEAKTGEAEISDLAACLSRQFVISEKTELPDGCGCADLIMDVCASPVLNDTRIINGKLLIKGEVMMNIIYCAAQNSGKTEKFTYSLAFSEVIDSAEITEDALSDITLSVKSKECSVRNDSKGEMKSLELSAVCEAQIRLYREKSIEFVCDAYCTDSLPECRNDTVSFFRLCENISEAFSCESVLELDGTELSFISFGEVRTEKSISGRTVKLNVSAPVTLVYKDADGNLSSAEKTFSGEYSVNVKTADSDFIAEPYAVLSGYSCTAPCDERFTLRAEFFLKMNVFSVKKKNVVLDFLPGEKKKSLAPNLTVYFPEKDEKLWDIARMCSSSVSLIREENGTAGETAEENKALIIPVL